MRSIFISAAFLSLCAFGLYGVTEDFQKTLTLNAAQDSAITTLTSNAHRLQFTGDERVSSVVKTWQDAVGKFPNSPEALIGLAKAHLAASARQLSFPDRIEHLCTTYQNLTKAAQRSPHSARLQISLADIKSQIKNPNQSCHSIASKNKKEAGSNQLTAEAHLQRAIQLEPFNTNTLYLAAVVYRAMDRKDESLELLRKVQEISPMTAAQREYTYNLVKTERELQLGMPKKYPEIISWYSHFERQRPYELQQWNATFVESFRTALGELKSRLRDKKISQEEYGRFVIHLSRQTAISTSDSLRKEIDEILSVVYQIAGKTEWSQVLAMRARMSRIPVAKAALSSDKTPRSTMLYHWVSDEQHLVRSLDSRSGSLGLFVPPNRTMRMLVIESGQGAPRVDPESLELFVSEDNKEFLPISGNIESRTFSVDGVHNIVFTFDKTPFRYLKIVSNASGSRRFNAPLSRLLQAFE